MDFTDNVLSIKEKLIEFEKVTKLLSSENIKTKESNLKTLELAKLKITQAYSLGSILYCLDCCNGLDPSSTGSLNELIRIKEYVKKINNIEGNKSSDDKPKAKDPSVAARMIQFELLKNDNNNLSNKKARLI